MYPFLTFFHRFIQFHRFISGNEAHEKNTKIEQEDRRSVQRKSIEAQKTHNTQ